MSHSSATMNVEEQRAQGNAMQASFKENQAKLHEQSDQGFGPQNDIQRRVAEQRSENEHKINESSEEIEKKESTVQASSDILKGENYSAQSKFVKEHETEKGKQHLITQEPSESEMNSKLAELRRRTG